MASPAPTAPDQDPRDLLSLAVDCHTDLGKLATGLAHAGAAPQALAGLAKMVQELSEIVKALGQGPVGPGAGAPEPQAGPPAGAPAQAQPAQPGPQDAGPPQPAASGPQAAPQHAMHAAAHALHAAMIASGKARAGQ